MRRPRAKNLGKTSELPKPNPYAKLLMGDYAHKAFDIEKAPDFKGKWRSEIFKQSSNDYPVDVEIGTGNGYHFAHKACENLDRGLVGLEIKYKPIIQSIRRALRGGAEENAYIVRYDAARLTDLFDAHEINNVYIHHPDPWSKKNQLKHRLIQEGFLKDLWSLMKEGSFVEFKTDSEDYYDWALEVFKSSDFTIDFETRDLHKSERADTNFVTHFEKIFLEKGQPIFYLLAYKKS